MGRHGCAYAREPEALRDVDCFELFAAPVRCELWSVTYAEWVLIAPPCSTSESAVSCSKPVTEWHGNLASQ